MADRLSLQSLEICLLKEVEDRPWAPLAEFSESKTSGWLYVVVVVLISRISLMSNQGLVLCSFRNMTARLEPLIEAVGGCCQFLDGSNAGIRAEEAHMYLPQQRGRVDTIFRYEVFGICSNDVCAGLVVAVELMIARNSAVA